MQRAGFNSNEISMQTCSGRVGVKTQSGRYRIERRRINVFTCISRQHIDQRAPRSADL